MKNKIVVITGASSGIGRATALRFAREEHTVVLAARRTQALEEVALECRNSGAQAIVVKTDVTKEEDVIELARQAAALEGRIDVWVNDAAVAVYGAIDEIPYPVVRRIIDVNILGYIHGVRAVFPYFRALDRGTLINIASMVSVTGQPFSALYSLSKFAVRGLSVSLQQEFASHKNIHICVVHPQTVDTPLFQQAANFSGRKVKAMPPVIEPEVVADTVVGLAAHPRKEVFVGNMAKIASLERTFMPAIFDKTFPKMVELSQFGKEESDDYEGNLFEPMPQCATVHGNGSADAS